MKNTLKIMGGVKPVKLKDSKGNYAKSALVLVYLARNHPHTKA